jgi:hypothetical protein
VNKRVCRLCGKSKWARLVVLELCLPCRLSLGSDPARLAGKVHPTRVKRHRAKPEGKKKKGKDEEA